MEIITRNEKILYIGIDVHKDTYSLCCFDFHKNELSDEMTIKATTKSVVKYLEAIKKKHREEILFACGYEAEPTGYGLCRGLQKAGYGCVLMAPTTMSNPEGKKQQRLRQSWKSMILQDLQLRHSLSVIWDFVLERIPVARQKICFHLPRQETAELELCFANRRRQ